MLSFRGIIALIADLQPSTFSTVLYIFLTFILPVILIRALPLFQNIIYNEQSVRHSVFIS